MIDVRDGLFRLSTANTAYWFRLSAFGHLEHLHYGAALADQDPEPLAVKRSVGLGSTVAYDRSDPAYCLDNLCLEWSGTGRGDYRHPPAELKLPGGDYASDFIYRSHRVVPGALPPDGLPGAYGDDSSCQTLELTLGDEAARLTLLLYYTVYPDCDVITRRAVLRNDGEKPVSVRRLMSAMVDLPDRDYRLVTLDGAWIKEAHRHERPVEYGMYVNASTTGASSNRHNPGFMLAGRGADEEQGRVYGFNLVYSGNHYGSVEKGPHDLVRVQLGINPHCFEWNLEAGKSFHTPEAVMTVSDRGFNGMSQNFHRFVNGHIVRGEWKDRERPVLMNNWEAYFFHFTQGKLLRLARRAKRLGIELFVLDDGWFGRRDSDSAGLGDYWVNRRKFPRGLAHFAGRLRRMGLGFGLWFEPEMVNPDSDLFRAHPDWAVTTPGRQPCLGRNQLVLDLCRPEVRDYIVESVGKVLDETGASYVKWDMNRHLSDARSPVLAEQGEFFHRYMLGLYEILERIFRPRPHILLESCSSGGNRFDLGMLCFSPQVWSSDDTDPVERLEIQGGLSLLYPPSSMGAHVSSSPHQQTLRETALSTRFNVAAFGSLGYELDLSWLTPVEKRELREQIAFYKRHRRTFQYGTFWRLEPAKPNKRHWQVLSPDGSEAVAGFYQTLSAASEGPDALPLRGLDPKALYTVESRPQSMAVRRFGGLLKHIMPVALSPDGLFLRLANRFHAVPDARERYAARGDLLMEGVQLANQFMGTGHNDRIRMLGDGGSTLYLVTRTEAAPGGKETRP